jgi:hypothetical protein
MGESGAVARIRFEPDWQETVEGDLRPGGQLEVEYESERRRQIFGARLAAGVMLHVLFAPGGQSQVEPLGSGRVVLRVPPDAADVTMWFRAIEHDGAEAWDSRFGVNYHFPVDRG